MNKCIAWFIDNPVASNLLMWLLIAGGLVVFPTLYREELPDIQVDMITVRVIYPQATAAEVEESICIKLEEELAGLEGTKKVRTTSAESMCMYTLELHSGTDKARTLRDVKNKVDQIDSFPESIERPVVSEVRASYAVLQITLSGPADEHTLKAIGKRMERELMDLPEVSQVALAYVRPDEISIEISELALRRYQLTMEQVANEIRVNSLNMPGGLIKGRDGQLTLKTEQQRYWEDGYKAIVVAAKADGTRVTLGDIATINDGFKDEDVKAHFDGERAIILDVRRIGDEDVIEVAKAVKNYLHHAETWLPDGIKYQVWQDESQELVDRMDTLANNAISGLILVIITLSLFMRIRLAFWVTAGIPIALMGSVLLFPALSISISTISVAAVMLVLGIVVDDAVVVGERIFSYQNQGYAPAEAAKLGAQEVSVPVIFGVLTTVATFAPLLGVSGPMGSVIAPIALVVISILLFSLIESQLILPGHLAHGAAPKARISPPTGIARYWEWLVGHISSGLDWVVVRYYRPWLAAALNWRYASLSVALGLLIITFGVMASGRLVVQFFPAVPGERLYASVTLPEGTPVAQTEQVIAKLEAAAAQLAQEMDSQYGRGDGESLIDHRLVSLGKQLIKGSIAESNVVGSHFVEMALELDLPEDYQGPGPNQYAKRWRELVGPIPGAVKQTFDANMMSMGKAIELQVRGDDLETLNQVAGEIKAALYSTPGVIDIFDSFEYGKQEILLTLLPHGHNLGLSTRDLANQVRQAFYGEEVQRIQRDKEEVRVYVRYPEAERDSLGDLENMRIRTSNGIEVPFTSVARIDLGRGLSKIERIDGRRVVNVMADVDTSQITAEEVLAKLDAQVLPQLREQYPALQIRYGGEAEEQGNAAGELIRACLLALFLVYALLAIPLKSYLQPLIVMSAIPFGLVGAIYAHLLMGEPFVFFSILGIVALSGVVINASLVLVDKINRLHLQQGLALDAAILEAASERFRPIFLTTSTTFIGLVPLLSTSELAVRNLFVPMALSLSGGILFSTLITLVLVPVLYRVTEDVRKRLRKSMEVSESLNPEAL